MKESKTTYSYMIKHMQEPSFQKVWDIAYDFVRKLPSELCDELHESLNRGVDILDSEPLLQMYIYAFGKMHNAKLQFAFNHLQKKAIKHREIEIIDYGCGQGLATICYHDFIREHNIEQRVRRITLIEPSEMALSRAELLCSRFFPNADIIAINKQFDDLSKDDLVMPSQIPTIHLLSNILDVDSYDLTHFSRILKEQSLGDNEYVIVSPLQNLQRVQRLKTFATAIQKDVYYEDYLEKWQLNPEKDWTCAVLLCTQNNNTIEYNCDEVYEEAKILKEAKLSHKNQVKNGNEDCYREVFRKLQICAEQGDKRCQNMLGIWFECGFGTEQDYQLSLKWYEKSAEQEYSAAYSNLGDLYLNGNGVEQDFDKAIHYYYKGVNNNHPGCQVKLGVCFFKGIGTEKDYDKAFFMFTEAAKQGNIDAINNLAICYRKGYGTEQNIEKAIQLFTKAAQSGDEKSIKNIIRLFSKKEGLVYFGDEQYDVFVKAVELGIESASNVTLPNINTDGNSFKDSDNVVYSHDGKRVLRAELSYAPKVIGHSIIETATGTIVSGDFSRYVIPEGVRIICDNAFGGHPNLTEIVIPSSVNFIGEGAFHDCWKLNNVQLPSNIVHIGEGAFWGTPIRNILLPMSLKNIDGNPFERHVKLISESNNYIVIDNVLYTADMKKLIAYCDSSSYFTIPEGVEDIGANAFSRCDMKGIVFPSTLKMIESNAFRNCSELSKNISLPETIEEIQKGAFACCYFKNGCVTLPANIRKIDPEAFTLRNVVQLVKVPEGRRQYYQSIFPSWFSNQIIDEDYIYESGLFLNLEKTEVFATTDLNEEGIEKIEIPKSVKKIRDGAFYSVCCLEEIRILNPHLEIAEEAFDIENIEFLDIRRIVVPPRCVKRFKKALPNLKDIIFEGNVV